MTMQKRIEFKKTLTFGGIGLGAVVIALIFGNENSALASKEFIIFAIFGGIAFVCGSFLKFMNWSDSKIKKAERQRERDIELETEQMFIMCDKEIPKEEIRKIVTETVDERIQKGNRG